MFYKLVIYLMIVLIPSIVVSAEVCPITSVDNGTVVDIRTQLIWKQCSEKEDGSCSISSNDLKLTWVQALDYVQLMNEEGGYAGAMDWRVPNVKELLSLLENTLYCGDVVDFDGGWSSSPASSSTVYIQNGRRGISDKFPEEISKNHSFHFHLVRGG